MFTRMSNPKTTKPTPLLVDNDGHDITAFAIYSEGNLKKPNVKNDIEKYFDSEIRHIKMFLNETKKDKW
jgi:hypothetical protein